MRPVTCVIVFSLALMAIKSHSLEAPISQPQENWDIKLGAFSMSKSLPWKGANNQALVLPGFDVRKGNWQFSIETPIKYHLPKTNQFHPYMALTVRNDGYDSDTLAFTKLDTHKVFTGYDKPKDEIVAIAGFNMASAAFEASTDISNHSNGVSLTASYAYPVMQWQKRFQLSMGPAIYWHNKNYVNYYYGVSDTQVNEAVNRSFYHTQSATNYQFFVKAQLKIDASWMMLVNLNHTQLDNHISDSPLIESKYQQAVSVVIAYQL